MTSILTPSQRAVRWSAAYDLAVTWPLAVPGAQGLLHGGVSHLHGWLALPGTLPAMDVQHQFFAGLLGAVVVVWSLARWFAAPAELTRLGRWDVLSRLAFAAWQVGAVLQGLSPLLLVFTAFELLFAAAQRSCFRGVAPLTRSGRAAAPRCPTASRS